MDLLDMNITNGETEWRFKICVINFIDVATIRRQLLFCFQKVCVTFRRRGVEIKYTRKQQYRILKADTTVQYKQVRIDCLYVLELNVHLCFPELHIGFSDFKSVCYARTLSRATLDHDNVC